MNKSIKKNLVAAILSALMVSGMGACQTGIGGPDLGGLFYHDLTRSENRDTVIGLKRGETCQNSILSLFAAGDNSLPQAAMNGAIREIQNITFKTQGILMGLIWARNCTIVYGR
ncbi:MAG: hypothetical protein KDK39_03455 [Leptospiraceae bacterium]|nr:hypothetical protein [Leptospiraceae bacterium]